MLQKIIPIIKPCPTPEQKNNLSIQNEYFFSNSDIKNCINEIAYVEYNVAIVIRFYVVQSNDPTKY